MDFLKLLHEHDSEQAILLLDNQKGNITNGDYIREREQNRVKFVNKIKEFGKDKFDKGWDSGRARFAGMF